MEAEVVTDEELVFDDSFEASLVRREAGAQTIVREGDLLVGKYRVERIPGRFGLGMIADARHLELGQRVTLKYLVSEACAFPEFVERFVREARSAVRIEGEHVARVTDVGRLDSGAPYMVREFLRGPDLADVVKVRGALPIDEAVDYIIQAAEGVAEGHALGIVHRNLRPNSLVVCRRTDGSPLVKVFDFAAAESLHVDPFTERAVSLVGTSAIMASLPYLAPEQIRDPADVDARADVYALATILWELITGLPVFAAESAPALLASVAADPARSLRDLRPDAPAELDQLVLRCLAKNRALRCANMGELVGALSPFASPGAHSSIQRIVRLSERALDGTVRALHGEGKASRATPPVVAPAAPPTLRIPPPLNPLTKPDDSGSVSAVSAADARADSNPGAASAAGSPAAEEGAPASSAAEEGAPASSDGAVSAKSTTIVPPPRSSLPSGVSRSWLPASDQPPPPSRARRLFAIGVIAACSGLAVALASRDVSLRSQASPETPLPRAAAVPSLEPLALPAAAGSSSATPSSVDVAPPSLAVSAASPPRRPSVVSPSDRLKSVAPTAVVPSPGTAARTVAANAPPVAVGRRPATTTTSPPLDLFSSPE